MDRIKTQLRLEDYEAFLFDLDGTLIDGSDRHFVSCVFETGKEFGCDDFIIPPGSPLRQYLRAKFPDMTDEMVADFYEKNRQRMLTTPRPVRFHDDVMAFIERYPGIPRAIVTNCRDWELALTENCLDLRTLFEIIVYKTDDVPGKPAADLYLKAAEAFALPPQKCLVFEDSATGISSGKNAGMTVVGIDRGVHRDFQEADFVIASFDEIENWK